MKLFLGILCILIGIIYLLSLFKRRSYKNSDIWDKSMLFRGFIGGLGFILIGVALIAS